MRIGAIAAIFLGLGTMAAGAQEFLTSKGRLSDDAFYRAVACQGRTDLACRARILKWSPSQRRNLTVTIAQIEQGFPPEKAERIVAAFDRAMERINAAHAGLTISRAAPDRAADAPIKIFLVNSAPQERMTRVESPLLRGQSAQIGYVHVAYRRNTIDSAHIAISRAISTQQVDSVALEELVQSLGLLTDILNPYYTERSIFAEDCNCTTDLRGQDLMALRRHYPVLR